MTRCITNVRVARRARIRVLGTELHQVHAVTFKRRGGGRTKGLKLRVLGPGGVGVVVPRNAAAGTARVHSAGGVIQDSPQTLTIGTYAELRKAQAGWRFPVRGRFDFGGGAARFGAPRGGRRHQGQDVFARCGTRMVAARGGRVKFKGFQGASGHYIVIRGAGTRRDFVYMHLLRPAFVSRGQSVRTGQVIGKVGQTGNASGCHLHFEIWQGAWYRGGRAINPLPSLKYWKTFS